VYLLFDLFAIHSIRRNGGAVYTWLNQGTGHLWYLFLVPQLYLLYALWPRRRAWLVALAALALQTWLCVVRVYGPLPDELVRQIALVHGYEIFPFWIAYFAVGVAMGRAARSDITVPLRSWLIALATLGVAGGGYLLLNLTFEGAQYARFVSGTGAFLDPVLPLLVLAVIAWVLLVAPPLMQRSQPLTRATRMLSDLSLGIYIIHPIPLYGLGLVLGPSLASGTPLAFLPLCAMVLLTIAAAAVITRVIAATPLAISVGLRRVPAA
jgi:surface polysaccharide O-acyltransferase-like enzyme